MKPIDPAEAHQVLAAVTGQLRAHARSGTNISPAVARDMEAELARVEAWLRRSFRPETREDGFNG